MARIQTPAGAIPRGCDNVPRVLADKPQKFTANGRESASFHRGRLIACNRCRRRGPRVTRPQFVQNPHCGGTRQLGRSHLTC